MRDYFYRRTGLILLCSLLLCSACACTKTEDGQTEEPTSAESTSMEAKVDELLEKQKKNTEEETETTEEEEEDTTEEEDEDYSQYYSDKKNTEQPRSYKEDEIEFDIREESFIEDLDEVYVNTDEYLGKMIRIQGKMISQSGVVQTASAADGGEDETPSETQQVVRTDNGAKRYFVYRQGVGYCGTDGDLCGFEFTYNGTYPEDGQWIEVVGKLRQYMEGDFAYLTLDAISVKVVEQEGEFNVSQ